MRRFLIALALIAAAACVPFLLEPRGYTIRVLCIALLFAALAQAWNIVGGLARQTSLGHAAFFGAGAYTSTLLLINFGISPWLGMIAAAVIGGIMAFLIALPTMRLRGHYFALATLAFAEVMRVIGNSWSSVTGGPVGLSVPFRPDSLWMLQFKVARPYFWIMLAALVAVTAVFVAISSSKIGYRLRAIRENVDAAEAIGIDTAGTKIIAAVISGAITASLGTLYAQFQFFFDPDTVFGLASISVRIALIAIIGGIGTVAGPIIGALFIIPLEELANTFLSGGAAGVSQLAYGLLLIAVILLEPRGLIALGRNVITKLSRRAAP
ncbi:branched-chain amino acid ABC transporter permease [Bradyrhizobium sp. G127]|uniref:branched-chain amino acid ABC transporter permease n=1 Tax=Bradyrhizobium sp. G127 TaxID=2904800 RepID=UPI001F38A6EB|nr:branched-chain amino acid ABC transporter permease [Bradyrhizobium sp. G127]